MTANETARALEQARSLQHVLRGDAEALALCDGLFRLTQIWDDLVDRDKAVAPEDVSRAFWLALVELPANPFFRRHEAELRPLLAACVTAWQDATELERGDGHERTLAFVLRDAVGGFVSHCAWLLGGYHWLRRVSPTVRRIIHDETLDDYLRGLA